MKHQANKLGYCLLNMHLDLQEQETLLLNKATVLSIVLSTYPLIPIRKLHFSSVILFAP